MHKDEAAKGFFVLGQPDRVKIIKMLYNRGSLTFVQLLSLIGCSEEELKQHLDVLIQNGFVSQNGSYSVQKDYVDELLDFLRTPCGCSK